MGPNHKINDIPRGDTPDTTQNTFSDKDHSIFQKRHSCYISGKMEFESWNRIFEDKTPDLLVFWGSGSTFCFWEKIKIIEASFSLCFSCFLFYWYKLVCWDAKTKYLNPLFSPQPVGHFPEKVRITLVWCLEWNEVKIKPYLGRFIANDPDKQPYLYLFIINVFDQTTKIKASEPIFTLGPNPDLYYKRSKINFE